MKTLVYVGAMVYLACGGILARAAYPTVWRHSGPFGLTNRPVWMTLAWIVLAWPYLLTRDGSEP